jgi:hypothetical protein
MNFQTLNKQRKWILILAAIGAISVFLPWFTISAEGLGMRMSESQNGFRGTGVLVFLAFVACGILSLMGDQTRVLEKTMWMTALCAGAIALLFVVIHLAKTSGSGDGFGFAQAGPGFGSWIALVASIAAMAAAWVLRNPGDTLKGGLDSLKHDLAKFSGPAAPAAAPAASAGSASSAGTAPANSTASTNGMARNSTASQNPTTIDDLEKLIELKNQGKLTEEEYQRIKAKLR